MQPVWSATRFFTRGLLVAAFLIGSLWLVYCIEGMTATERSAEDYSQFSAQSGVVTLLAGVGLVGASGWALVLALLGRPQTTLVAALAGLATCAATPAGLITEETRGLVFWTALVGGLLLLLSLATIKERHAVWPPPRKPLGRVPTMLAVLCALPLLGMAVLFYWLVWVIGVDDPGLVSVHEEDELGWVFMFLFTVLAGVFFWPALELVNRLFWKPQRIHETERVQ